MFSPQPNQHEKLIAITSYLRMAVETFYTRDNRWALGKGVRAMHCTACDAELILANVVPEIKAAIRGFENHTLFAWDAISECANSLHETWA